MRLACLPPAGGGGGGTAGPLAPHPCSGHWVQRTQLLGSSGWSQAGYPAVSRAWCWAGATVSPPSPAGDTGTQADVALQRGSDRAVAGVRDAEGTPQSTWEPPGRRLGGEGVWRALRGQRAEGSSQCPQGVRTSGAGAVPGGSRSWVPLGPRPPVRPPPPSASIPPLLTSRPAPPRLHPCRRPSLPRALPATFTG